MGYVVGKSKKLIANTEYLGSEVNDQKGFAKDKFTLTDRDGNKISYELQSIQNAGRDGFQGYFVAPANIDYDDELLSSAKKYFAEHPEERSTKLDNDISIAFDYCKVLVQEAAADSFRRESGRKPTTMEKCFLFQNSYLDNINQDKDNMYFLSWEQITGQQDFMDDHIDLSRQSIKNDTRGLNTNNQAYNAFSDEWEQSADRGEKSLRERMKQNANAAITVMKNGDRGKVMTVQSGNQVPQTINEDEKNALIRYAIKRGEKSNN